MYICMYVLSHNLQKLNITMITGPLLNIMSGNVTQIKIGFKERYTIKTEKIC